MYTDSETDNSDNDENEKNIIFKDENDSSDNDSDSDFNENEKNDVTNNVKFTGKKITSKHPFFSYIFVDPVSTKFINWKNALINDNIKFRSLLKNDNWNEFFSIIEKKPYYSGMEKILTQYVKSEKIILPHAELLFNAFNITSPKNIRVIFIGQDPYANTVRIGKEEIPQALGTSFSLPINFNKTESLKNIFKNMIKFGHIKKTPNSSSLGFWIIQGCFMLNSALTTFQSKSGSHMKLWKNFTDDLISYLNKNFENLVFLAWGKEAHKLCLNIDTTKHKIITSSHPSPYSCNNTFTGFSYKIKKNSKDRETVVYPSFNSVDHFSEVNIYLKSIGKKQIFWELVD